MAATSKSSTNTSTDDPGVVSWVVATLMLLMVTRGIGALLSEVQLATGDVFGGMGSLATGFHGDVVTRTQALLAVWREAADSSEKSSHLIERTAGFFTGADLLLLTASVGLIAAVWRRLMNHPTGRSATDGRWSQLRTLSRGRRWWVPVAAVAGFGTVQIIVRAVVVRYALHNQPRPDSAISAALNAAIYAVWAAATLKVLALGLCVLLLVALLYDTGLIEQWWKPTLKALWRLRLAVAASVLYLGLLVGDPTGQALDLVRRWLDNGYTLVGGVLALVGSAALGWAIWLVARRIVLSDQPDRAASADLASRVWLLVLAIATAAATVVSWRAGLRELRAVAVVTGVVLGLSLLAWWLGRRTPELAPAMLQEHAATERARDAAPAQDQLADAARRAARGLAVAQPVLLLVVTAAAFAPVPLVLWLSAQYGLPFLSGITVDLAALVLAPSVAVKASRWLSREDKAAPSPNEGRFWLTFAILGAVTAIVFVASAWLHSRFVSPLLVVPITLAMLLLILGVLQTWSETHNAPAGLLLIGLTRVPTAALLVITALVAGYVFSDGSAHAVRHRDGGPDPVVGARRPGISLVSAFNEWVAANCAGAGHAGRRVPLVLVAAPGGGLRAAYWTASALTDLFGPDRTSTVEDCSTAAPSDRVFAIGGASGGSVGALAYTSGLEPSSKSARPARWYDQQLAQPDFLTDPLTWMLTVDLARTYLGFGGDDRARRLEKQWSAKITGIGDDFFAATWGLGGHRPLMVLTGTEVETGCRLNVSGLRLTNPTAGDTDNSCVTPRTSDQQPDPPATSELLDYLCGSSRGSPARSLSSATAALLSARFPYISPSGQLYRCAPEPGDDPGPATPTAIVDGGYAENTGIQLLLNLWSRLEPLIAIHNAASDAATIVPIFLDVDNHYAQVAPPATPARTIEMLVPPSTKSRPDHLDDFIMEGEAAATFTGPLPGTSEVVDLPTTAGRYLRIGPRTSPGLPAPLAWSLSRLATDDLDAQRAAAMCDDNVLWLRHQVTGRDAASCSTAGRQP